jgi:hypothetical protein
MKPRHLIVALLVCLTVATLLLVRERRPAVALPMVRFVCLTNGTPANSSLTGLGPVAAFARSPSSNAGLVQAWLRGGTNAALFTVSNTLGRAIFLLSSARLATPKDMGGWGQHTPLLLEARHAEPYLAPGQSVTVPVALVAPEGPWRVQFCYHIAPTDDSSCNPLIGKIVGTANRGSSGFIYSEWVSQ